MFQSFRQWARTRKWQDWTILIVDCVFAPALIPLVQAPAPPALLAAVPTAIGLWVLVVSFWTLGLRLAPISTMSTALMWTLLSAQSIIYQVTR